ncbi:hypothetical protein H072_10744 [Dactylellina haptotyla CBS 200.50]|uniref:Uncharacterized protein n=1 Tax=Dactylellina haptotyla (strain CBS 200.50) TaxID=1284197 RepID=S8A3V6_DACHA|nr:hypothetical protein H072_10744 [Dactylellina haptotyla CBS 200.50]
MFSKSAKYAKTSEEEDDDEEPARRRPTMLGINKNKVVSRSSSANPSSASTYSKTLDHYFQKKPLQQSRSSPTPRLSEPIQRLNVSNTALKRETPTKKVAIGETRSAPVQFHQKVQQPRKRREEFSEDEYSEPEKSSVIVRQPSTAQSKPGPRPSRQIGHRVDSGARNVRFGGSSSLISKPFSAKDLLGETEASDSEEVDDDVDTENHIEEDISADDDESMRSLSDDNAQNEEVFVISTSSDEPDNSRRDEASEEEESEEESENDVAVTTPTKATYGHRSTASIDITPRRSMANPHMLEEDHDELEREEEEAKEEILREALKKKALADAKRNFDIIVTIPTYEEVCNHLFNPDEWEAIAIDSRWTGDDGHATYRIIYKDGHLRTVDANEILEHIDPQTLEDFENDLFSKEENPETWYYPNFKAPGGAFAGGTSITSGQVKRRGRRSVAKIFLDNCFRLGMPEEFNIPMPDSSDFDSDEDIDTRGGRNNVDPSQYDKFDITDAEILASIRENSSDNESWGAGKKPGRGRPRGRASAITRSSNPKRGTGRGRVRRPVPSRGDTTPTRRPRASNVVKASTTSRGRGRPRGNKLPSRTESSASNLSCEDSPLVIITPVKTPSSRGRPKGSKNLSKPALSYISDSSASEVAFRVQPPQPKKSPLSSAAKPHLSPIKRDPKPAPIKKPKLKPSRALKPSTAPSGARGPGRPPKKEEDLIEETIRMAGGNISHTRNLSQVSQTELERPNKRRRIKFGKDGPEESKPSITVERRHILPSSVGPRTQSPKQRKLQPKEKKKAKSPDDDLHLDVDHIINKMLLDGSPAYHVQLKGPRKETIWVRLEDLQTKESKLKVRAFESTLREREAVSRQLYDSISAQLQLEKDKQRVAEREAQILGKFGSPVGKEKNVDEEKKEREKEDQKRREKIAKRLKMQETLFAGT